MTARLVFVTLTLLVGKTVLQVLAVDRVASPPTALPSLARELGDWHTAADHAFDASTVNVLRADDYVARTYVRRAESADLLVAYYASQREGQTIHSPMNCLPAAGWQPVHSSRVQIIVDGSGPIQSNRYVIQKGLEKQLVFYWYQSARRTVASEYAAKAHLVLDSIRSSRSEGALVRVMSPLGRNEAAAEQSALDFVRAMYPVLARHLPG
jgi:EpsI family protein